MIGSIAIVGASLAGATAAERLRDLGYDGQLVLVGEEHWHPYQRPPLSKTYLWPGAPDREIMLRDEAWYEAQRVDLRLGVRAAALRPAERRILLADGTSVEADRILLTTGARPRQLSGLPLADNVHYLRTREDADAIAAALSDGTRLVIIGMGVIGAEVAATAVRAGAQVTVVEPAVAPMFRSLGSAAGEWLKRRHAERGVAVRCRRRVEEYRREGSRIRAVSLDDGTRLDCDALVVGIGVEPAAELAKEAGLTVNDGIIVGEDCSTSNPHVFAAGDVANQPGFFSGRARLETFQNACAQAASAAEAMLGRPVDCRRPCSFWTDQFELNIQACGRVADELRIVVRGDMSGDSFTLFYLDEGVLAGALAVNQPAEMAVAKRMILERRCFDVEGLRDTATPLRALLTKRA